MEQFSTNMEHVRSDVAAQTSVYESAKTAFKAIAMKIEAALSHARASGATDETLLAVTAVKNDVNGNADALASAIVANTPSDEAPVSLTQPATESTVVPDNIPADPKYGLAAPLETASHPPVEEPIHGEEG